MVPGRTPCPADRAGANTRAFRVSDWIAGAAAAAAALAVYGTTLAPTVTLEQSGALAVAGEHFGVGRVPGYPLWHLLAHGAVRLFGFVRFRGQPNPAWATNLLSAFFGALSCGLVALLAAAAARAARRRGADAEAAADRKWADPGAGALAGVLFAVSPVMWSQSVITETHTLTLFLLLAFLAALARWLHARTAGAACAMAAVFGAGLAQSHMLVLLLPALVLGLLLAEPRLGREFGVAAALLLVAPFVLWRLLPSPVWRGVGVGSVLCLGVALPLRLSPAGGVAVRMALLVAGGLAFYAYLPLAAEGNPPMQFSYSRTWVGFWHAFTRGQYERIAPSDVLGDPLGFLGQLGWYGRLLAEQYGVPVTLAALAGLLRIRAAREPWRAWWAVCGLTLLLFSAGIVWGANPHRDIQDRLIQRVKFIPSFALWAVLAGVGLAELARWAADRLLPATARAALRSLRRRRSPGVRGAGPTALCSGTSR